MDASPSRRDLLQAGAATSGLALLSSLSGCAGLLDSVTGESSTNAGELDLVPDGASTVLSADVETVLADSGTRKVVRAWLRGRSETSGDEEQPDNLDGLVSKIKDKSGLDFRKVSSVTMFSGSGGTLPARVLVHRTTRRRDGCDG